MKKIILTIVFIFNVVFVSNAVTYTVNSTGWANTGAGTSGDLLYCFNQVKATAGAPHTIQFTGLAGSPAVITFTSRVDLNTVNCNGLMINGETIGSWVCGNPGVVFVGGWTADLTLTNQIGVTIKAISMRSFDLNITGGSTNNVHGCWFNLNDTGTGLSGNSGAYLSALITISGSSNNVFGGTTCNQRNVITHGTSPFAWTGLIVNTTSNGTQFVGNYIGTDKTGNVSLKPSGATGSDNFVINASSTVVINQNVITSTDMAGIKVTGACPSLTILNNMIGVGASGAGITFSNDQGGIVITGTVNTLQITGNTISNNVQGGLPGSQTRGINYSGSSNGITISNNKVGTNSTGLFDGNDYGNQNGGIVILAGGATSNLVISNNVICRNGWVTLDNNACGVYISAAVTNITLNNNIIGVYADYSKAGNSGNGWSGFWVNSASTGISITDNVVGDNGNGTAGQKSHGLAFSGGASGITIYGNYVGVDPNGSDIGNWANGIELNPASNVAIGGTAAGQRNYIGFNKGANSFAGFPRSGGIAIIAATNVTIRNNYIGVGPTGAVAGHSNFSGTSSINHGIFSEGGTNQVLIGGTASATEGNVIANSGGNGIWIFAGSNIHMRNNSIYCNGLRGIGIIAGQNNGVTPPTINPLQTAPAVGFLDKVNGTATGTNVVEIYTTNLCPGVCANPESQQGQNLLATVTAAAGAFTYTHGSTIFNYITATQTKAGCIASNTATANCFTSEFSTCVTNTLPVTWIGFTAENKGNYVLLNWSTAFEKGAQRFMIERSSNGVDFTTIGSVEAYNIISGGQYTYTDTEPFQGKVYYRLKEIDTDGEFEYSVIRFVNSNVYSISLTVFPNPTNGIVSIALNNQEMSGLGSIIVYNTLGQEMYSQIIDATELSSGISVDLSNLAHGTYAVKVLTNQGEWVERLVKQ